MIKAIITQREERNRYGGLSDSLEKEYMDYFRRLEIMAIPVSNFVSNVLEFIDAVQPDMLILTGGGILPRVAYNYERVGTCQADRDRIEHVLICAALKMGIPILGICRGMQYLNYYFGGRISSFDYVKVPRVIKGTHPVETEGNAFWVNHFHNDGIFYSDLAEALIPIAVDRENGIIEAFECKEKRILGIQWHPERDGCDDQATAWVNVQIQEMVR